MGKPLRIGKWEIRGDSLIVHSDDENLIPSAEDIFRYIFIGQKDIGGILLENDPRNIIDGLHFSQYPLELSFEIKFSNSFDISLEVIASNEQVSIPISNWLNRESDHIIVKDTWYPFIKGALIDLHNYLNSIGVVSSNVISLKQYLLIKQNHTFEVKDSSPENMQAIEISKIIKHQQTTPIFTGKLYPYQQQGFNWLSYIDSQNIGCILADEMGLGKTIQLIALLANYAGKGKPCLVVSPTTIMENWRREILRFTTGVKVLVHQGSQRTGFANQLARFDVVIVSYETMVRDRYMIKMIDWNIVILDEAQAIKNPDAKRSKSVKLIPRRSSIAVTGTPVQNNLMDLWSISDFSIPGFLGTRSSFEENYPMDQDSAKRVEPLISPVMLRRRVNEVANDLPDKIEIPQPLQMDIASVKKYELLRQRTIEEYKGNANFVILQKLRMFCAHPFLIEDIGLDPAEYSLKYNRLLEILEEIFSNNQKALIFTSWVKMVDILINDIKSRFGVFTNKIDGSVIVSERQEIVDNFNQRDESGILVLNPIAGGVGLNITGANHVIHYNYEWNPAVIDQATARAYRRGQKKPVTVHSLYYIDTVEEVMKERVDYKRDIADVAIVGVEGKSEDIRYIMEALKRTPLSGVT